MGLMPGNAMSNGHMRGEEAGRSPKEARKCGGMDMVEEKRRGEVQKKRGSAMKWTFKINETSQSPI